MNVANKVVVVGAGAAGVAAAQRLTEAGFQVKILEQANRIGGKCLSIQCKDANGIAELGAIQVGIGYPKVTRYIKEVGLTLRDYWPARAMYHSGDNTPTYKTLSEDIWPLKDFRAIAHEASVMSSALKRFKKINDSNFTELPENSEFTKPFEEWADKLSLPHFKREYSIWMTAYGYGQLRQVPTFLALSLLNSSYGLIALRKANLNLRMISEGYGGLLNAMVEHYHLNVETNVRIAKIDREEDRIKVSYEASGNSMYEEFGYLVVASGIESLQYLLGQNTSALENQLIKDVTHSPYDVVVAKIPGLEKGGYVLPEFFDTLGRVVLISKNSSGGDEVILYVPRAGFQRPSFQELGDIVKRDMAEFGFEIEEIITVAHWDKYFPHFRTPSSYKALNDEQGKHRTFIVGAVARFEIVERAMQHAHDIVDEHIIKRPIAKKESNFRAIKDYLSANKRDL